MGGEHEPTKVGAGFLICCEGDCLLLHRAADSGNPYTWGLPGGNADSVDGHQLVATAQREAAEELGSLPDGMHIAGHLVTKRGKNSQKHYTVYVATISPAARAAYQPRLNNEHTAYRWFPLSEVTRLAEEQEKQHVLTGRSSGGGAPPAALADSGNVYLHPVVRIAFANHTESLSYMLPGLAP